MKKENRKIYNELLVIRCQQGNREALNELISNWEKRLWYYLRRLVDHEQDAWDLLQETWIAVIKDIRHLRNPESLPIWLYRIARNSAYGKFRKNKKNLEVVDFEDAEIEDSFDAMINFENAQQVHFALGQLELFQREILTLFFLEDFSLKEVSEILDIPVGTVKSRLFSARKRLKEVIEREEKSHGTI